MTRTLIIGDLHCKQSHVLPAVDELINKNNINKTIVLGDTQDDWNASTNRRIREAEVLAEFVNKNNVDLLVGNHDFPYIVDSDNPNYHGILKHSPGFDYRAYPDVHEIYKNLPWAAATSVKTSKDEWLCSHAGLTGAWAHGVKNGIMETMASVGVESTVQALNDVYLTGEYRLLDYCGYGRGGSDPYASPFWADRSELEADPVKGLKQIVGHSPVRTVFKMSTISSQLIFADTMSTWSDGTPAGDSSLVLIDDDTIKVVSIESNPDEDSVILREDGVLA